MADQNIVQLVAYCGLYCGACGAYKKKKCPGCAANEKASWCKVRKCCIEKKIKSCADCADMADKASCGKLNNFISKTIGLFTRSDRPGCIRKIVELGYDHYAEFMDKNNLQSVKRT